MASYSILIVRSAAKELEAVPLNDRRRLARRIQSLADNPRPDGCQKLSGEDKYRVRQGNDRIVYEIVDEQLIVTVIRIGNRHDVHRR